LLLALLAPDVIRAGGCTGGGGVELYNLPLNVSGESGCRGWFKGDVEWRVNTLSVCNFTYKSGSMPSAASLLFMSGEKLLASLQSPSGQIFVAPGGRVILSSKMDYPNVAYFVFFTYSCRLITPDRPIAKLVSNVHVYVSNKTSGGFLYLSNGAQIDGTSISYSFSVTNYRGLKPPSFFVGENRLPALESYDFTNATTKVDDGYAFEFTLKNPRDQMQVVGMFLYGTFGGVQAFSVWNYKYETIPVGQTITRKDTWCGQFLAPARSKSFSLKVSREEPGGYPVFYVGQGYPPGQARSDYILDTKKESFQELTVKNPNDPKEDGPNPGLWIVCTQRGFQGAFLAGLDF